MHTIYADANILQLIKRALEKKDEITVGWVCEGEMVVAHIVERLLRQGRLCHKVLGNLSEWRTARRHRLSQGSNRHRPEAGWLSAK